MIVWTRLTIGSTKNTSYDGRFTGTTKTLQSLGLAQDHLVHSARLRVISGRRGGACPRPPGSTRPSWRRQVSTELPDSPRSATTPAL